jgi:hypothetical protein
LRAITVAAARARELGAASRGETGGAQ